MIKDIQLPSIDLVILQLQNAMITFAIAALSGVTAQNTPYVMPPVKMNKVTIFKNVAMKI